MSATLSLFAYGTYTDYLANSQKYITLKPAMITKLKMITLVDLAAKNSQVSYAKLMEAT